jgi:transposase
LRIHTLDADQIELRLGVGDENLGPAPGLSVELERAARPDPVGIAQHALAEEAGRVPVGTGREPERRPRVVELAGRVRTEPNELELFAQSLGGDDEVVLEPTGNALPIARIIEPHVARVVLANPKALKGLTQSGPKTDKADARALARLLAGGWCRRCGRSTSRRQSCVDGSLVARSS